MLKLNEIVYAWEVKNMSLELRVYLGRFEKIVHEHVIFNNSRDMFDGRRVDSKAGGDRSPERVGAHLSVTREGNSSRGGVAKEGGGFPDVVENSG